MQTIYLYNVSLRSSLTIITLQLLALIVNQLLNFFDVDYTYWLYALSGLSFISAVVIELSTYYNLNKAKINKAVKQIGEIELPSLTVAIPARNETKDLDDCLQSLINSDYPKLEILVLDDCSQNKVTPEIIRSFAHAGVRFIAGKQPPDSWLAKNYAYSQLFNEANGDLIMFCGVDTRFQPESLKLMVKVMLEQNKQMVGYVPINIRANHSKFVANIVQPSRYCWELALPRWQFKRPPVLSTCWLITRQALLETGDFKAISHGHSPESFYARQLLRHDPSSYNLYTSSEKMGLYSFKSLAEQRATAIRTRYPQLHKRPEAVVVISMVELIVLIGPLIFLATGLLHHNLLLIFISGISSLILIINFAQFVTLTNRKFAVLSLIMLPVAVIYDVGLLNYSMWKYEFSEVIWKGRNVCIPTMRVLPQLPNIVTPDLVQKP
ncbi:MAG TPA: glycosyltransferase family 2 protein [Candidatus Saccharimonadales bacterium]|nr:glycosyltransferase family 2 protein [Candidatus Saccharimonadales bacterium]